MKIVVREIPTLEEVQVPGGDALGHRVRFTCPLGEGVAVLVPAMRRKFGWKVGAEVEVETSQATISDVKIWKHRGTMVPMLTPLQPEGDFQVRGLITPREDRDLIYVDAGGIEFVLPRTEELASFDVRPGDNIMFTLHGLGLWEIEQPGR